MKVIIIQSGILYPAKRSLKNKSEIKTSSDKQKLKGICHQQTCLKRKVKRFLKLWMQRSDYNDCSLNLIQVREGVKMSKGQGKGG